MIYPILTFVGVGFLYIWEKHCNYMDEIYLIMKEEWGNDKSFTYINELVGMYSTEKEALSDVGRIVKETLEDFTEEEAKRYRVTTDIKKLNGEEEFCNHEDDGVFSVAEVMSKQHGFNFMLYRFDIPFKDRFDLLHLECRR